MDKLEYSYTVKVIKYYHPIKATSPKVALLKARHNLEPKLYAKITQVLDDNGTVLHEIVKE